MAETLRPLLLRLGGPMGRDRFSKDSQGLFQREVDRPFPIARPSLVLIRSLPIKIPLQLWDVDVDEVMGTLRKSCSLQYFPFRTLLRRHDGLLSIFQLILTSKASLKLCISLNPSPLCFFALVSFLPDNLTHFPLIQFCIPPEACES
ncbi:unnamed protein product [Microthlaspi erraticum]|uniref:Uncharacterized protein n=1 Tax=Microthlaspi erraticum TaxID=1685480 RepID=A0A6D2JV11_9BRAS|nr:unnamed protein product [Microthlaspi erraticum]